MKLYSIEKFYFEKRDSRVSFNFLRLTNIFFLLFSFITLTLASVQVCEQPTQSNSSPEAIIHSVYRTQFISSANKTDFMEIISIIKDLDFQQYFGWNLSPHYTTYMGLNDLTISFEVDRFKYELYSSDEGSTLTKFKIMEFSNNNEAYNTFEMLYLRAKFLMKAVNPRDIFGQKALDFEGSLKYYYECLKVDLKKYVKNSPYMKEFCEEKFKVFLKEDSVEVPIFSLIESGYKFEIQLKLIRIRILYIKFIEIEQMIDIIVDFIPFVDDPYKTEKTTQTLDSNKNSEVEGSETEGNFSGLKAESEAPKITKTRELGFKFEDLCFAEAICCFCDLLTHIRDFLHEGEKKEPNLYFEKTHSDTQIILKDFMILGAKFQDVIFKVIENCIVSYFCAKDISGYEKPNFEGHSMSSIMIYNVAGKKLIYNSLEFHKTVETYNTQLILCTCYIFLEVVFRKTVLSFLLSQKGQQFKNEDGKLIEYSKSFKDCNELNDRFSLNIKEAFKKLKDAQEYANNPAKTDHEIPE